MPSMNFVPDTEVFTFDYRGFLFVWHGGVYIDVTRLEEEFPFEVINVWDISNDAPIIARAQEPFEAECRMWADDWIASYS